MLITVVLVSTLLVRLISRWTEPGFLRGTSVVLLETLTSLLAVVTTIAFFAGKEPNGHGMGEALGPAIFFGIPIMIFLIKLWPKEAKGTS
jgi:hypothetical protein